MLLAINESYATIVKVSQDGMRVVYAYLCCDSECSSLYMYVCFNVSQQLSLVIGNSPLCLQLIDMQCNPILFPHPNAQTCTQLSPHTSEECSSPHPGGLLARAYSYVLIHAE